MTGLIKGLDLCRGFFHEEAEPILKEHHPGLRYSAGLIGYGSDVLGYDDPVSRDHLWGPRFYLFLQEKDIDLAIHMVDYRDGKTIVKTLTKEEMDEVYNYGIDLFFNTEAFLD